MRLEKALDNLRAEFPDIPIFGNEISERETDEHRSLFFYLELDEYRKGTGGRGLIKTFHMAYLTREDKRIDVLKMIEAMETGTGLTFQDSTVDRGKIERTDEDAYMVQLRFTYQVRMCD